MLIRTLLAVTIAFAAAAPARAQGLIGLGAEPAGKVLGEALASPYGEALLRTFVAAVRRQGDAACLQQNALDDAALAAGGRAMLLRYGAQMARIMNDAFDRPAYLAALSAAAGPRAEADFERVKRDPKVRKLMALNRPVAVANVLDHVLEQFDRHVLVARIKLDPVSPIARGDNEESSEAVGLNPARSAEAALQQFMDKNTSRQLERYLELLDAGAAALRKGVATEAMRKTGPMVYFAGVDRDLAALCVGKR